MDRTDGDGLEDQSARTRPGAYDEGVVNDNAILAILDSAAMPIWCQEYDT